MKTNNTAHNRSKLINKLDGVNEVLQHTEEFLKQHLQENEALKLAELHAIRHTIRKLQETILHM